MKLYSIVFIWLALMMVHSAAASEGTGIVLGITSGKLYQRSSYNIESKSSFINKSVVLSPTECIVKSASLHYAPNLHVLDDHWDLDYRLQWFNTNSMNLFQFRSIRSCKSLGINLFQF